MPPNFADATNRFESVNDERGINRRDAALSGKLPACRRLSPLASGKQRPLLEATTSCQLVEHTSRGVVRQAASLPQAFASRLWKSTVRCSKQRQAASLSNIQDAETQRPRREELASAPPLRLCVSASKSPHVDTHQSRCEEPRLKIKSPTSPPTKSDCKRNLKAIIFAFCLLPFAFSCGKVGAPVPPSRITERARELTVVQRGPVIFISWPAPPLVKQDSSVSYIERIDIYRLAERRDEPAVLDEDDFENLSQIIGFLDRETIEAQASNGRLQFTDRIDLNRTSDLSSVRLRYAVRYVNRRGQMARFSATTAIEPALAIAMPPTGLSVKDQSQDRMEIVWSAPDANVDGARPASVVGYNIYRRQSRREEFGRPLNSDIVTETSFIDSSFRYEVEYVYAVRALSQGTTGLIESADSAPITFTPVDKFAPAAPDPVSIASANGTISLFWPRSQERDVTGYNIYRSETPDDEKSWVKLNEQPAEAVTFHDDRVTIGRKYFYRVTAIDQFNNESAPSRAVGETANP